MSGFFETVKYEYKKILSRKSAVITLILITMIILINPLERVIGNATVDGEVYESHYDAMVKDRGYARALNGRVIDGDLLTEMRDAYAQIPPGTERYTITPEYELYARPYSSIRNILGLVLSMGNDDLRNATAEELTGFYDARRSMMNGNINNLKISESAKETLRGFVDKLERPITFYYTDGYENFFSSMYISGILLALAVAVCLAPMFADEYSTGASQLILSSKHGKGKLIAAKLFTGITFAIALSAVLTLATLLMCGFIYGFDGFNAVIQVISRFNGVPYNFTVLGITALYAATCVLAATFTAAVTLLLSAWFKSPFGVIITMGMIIFIPVIFSVSSDNIFLLNLYQLLPASMMNVRSLTSLPYDFFGFAVMPYVFIPLFAALAAAAAIPFAWRGFKNHQAL